MSVHQGPSADAPRSGRRPLRRLLLGLLALLYGASIPWYRDSGAAPGTLLGLPDWAAVAVLCYALAALVTALLWLVTDMPEAPAEPPDRQGTPGDRLPPPARGRIP